MPKKQIEKTKAYKSRQLMTGDFWGSRERYSRIVMMINEDGVYYRSERDNYDRVFCCSELSFRSWAVLNNLFPKRGSACNMEARVCECRANSKPPKTRRDPRVWLSMKRRDLLKKLLADKM